MKENVKVVIIDSGVDINHPMLEGKQIKGFTISEKKTIKNFQDNYGHGTAIYSILSKSPIPVDIINIKIDGIEEGVDEELISEALKYIDNNIDADIINMSLGVNVLQDVCRLKDICTRLTDKGVIIVSAFDNAGSISYPAAFDNVIGVTNNILCKKTNQFVYYDDDIVNIGAMGNVQKVAWKSPAFIMTAGNSFACAHITNQCISYIANGAANYKDVLCELRKNAIEKYKSKSCVRKECFKIKKAVIFPFNKEMHSLVRFYKMLNFEIVDVYDTKYSGRVGASTSKILKDDVLEKKIKDINNIDFNSFDTMILGHTDMLSINISNDADSIKKQLVKEIIRNDKKIYSFDNLENIIGDSDTVDNNNVFWPEVKKENLRNTIQGKLYRISKPVLGVFGTSSKQGKFTLQLYLRRLLQEKGLIVGQIGTEPTSYLFGMDETYPMGYNSAVELKEMDAIAYLNSITQGISEKNSDIIIVGSQSGTVPYDTGNLGLYNISQYMFLQGTLPDAVVLCVNTFDEIEYIKRNVKFIEASIQSEVIALVVFPMNLRNEELGVYGGMISIPKEQYSIIKKDMKDKLNIPTYILGEMEDMNALVDLVIEYFS